ncbi:unnamed protein product, partial [Didymodactylos carnosus]
TTNGDDSEYEISPDEEEEEACMDMKIFAQQYLLDLPREINDRIMKGIALEQEKEDDLNLDDSSNLSLLEPSSQRPIQTNTLSFEIFGDQAINWLPKVKINHCLSNGSKRKSDKRKTTSKSSMNSSPSKSPSSFNQPERSKRKKKNLFENQVTTQSGFLFMSDKDDQSEDDPDDDYVDEMTTKSSSPKLFKLKTVLTERIPNILKTFDWKKYNQRQTQFEPPYQLSSRSSFLSPPPSQSQLSHEQMMTTTPLLIQPKLEPTIPSEETLKITAVLSPKNEPIDQKDFTSINMFMFNANDLSVQAAALDFGTPITPRLDDYVKNIDLHTGRVPFPSIHNVSSSPSSQKDMDTHSSTSLVGSSTKPKRQRKRCKSKKIIDEDEEILSTLESQQLTSPKKKRQRKIVADANEEIQSKRIRQSRKRKIGQRHESIVSVEPSGIAQAPSQSVTSYSFAELEAQFGERIQGQDIVIKCDMDAMLSQPQQSQTLPSVRSGFSIDNLQPGILSNLTYEHQQSQLEGGFIIQDGNNNDDDDVIMEISPVEEPVTPLQKSRAKLTSALGRGKGPDMYVLRFRARDGKLVEIQLDIYSTADWYHDRNKILNKIEDTLKSLRVNWQRINIGIDHYDVEICTPKILNPTISSSQQWSIRCFADGQPLIIHIHDRRFPHLQMKYKCPCPQCCSNSPYTHQNTENLPPSPSAISVTPTILPVPSVSPVVSTDSGSVKKQRVSRLQKRSIAVPNILKVVQQNSKFPKTKDPNLPSQELWRWFTNPIIDEHFIQQLYHRCGYHCVRGAGTALYDLTMLISLYHVLPDLHQLNVKDQYDTKTRRHLIQLKLKQTLEPFKQHPQCKLVFEQQPLVQVSPTQTLVPRRQTQPINLTPNIQQHIVRLLSQQQPNTQQNSKATQPLILSTANVVQAAHISTILPKPAFTLQQQQQQQNGGPFLPDILEFYQKIRENQTNIRNPKSVMDTLSAFEKQYQQKSNQQNKLLYRPLIQYPLGNATLPSTRPQFSVINKSSIIRPLNINSSSTASLCPATGQTTLLLNQKVEPTIPFKNSPPSSSYTINKRSTIGKRAYSAKRGSFMQSFGGRGRNSYQSRNQQHPHLKGPPVLSQPTFTPVITLKPIINSSGNGSFNSDDDETILNHHNIQTNITTITSTNKRTDIRTESNQRTALALSANDLSRHHLRLPSPPVSSSSISPTTGLTNTGQTSNRVIRVVKGQSMLRFPSQTTTTTDLTNSLKHNNPSATTIRLIPPQPPKIEPSSSSKSTPSVLLIPVTAATVKNEIAQALPTPKQQMRPLSPQTQNEPVITAVILASNKTSVSKTGISISQQPLSNVQTQSIPKQLNVIKSLSSSLAVNQKAVKLSNPVLILAGQGNDHIKKPITILREPSI